MWTRGEKTQILLALVYSKGFVFFQRWRTLLLFLSLTFQLMFECSTWASSLIVIFCAWNTKTSALSNTEQMCAVMRQQLAQNKNRISWIYMKKLTLLLCYGSIRRPSPPLESHSHPLHPRYLMPYPTRLAGTSFLDSIVWRGSIHFSAAESSFPKSLWHTYIPAARTITAVHGRGLQGSFLILANSNKFTGFESKLFWEI